MNKRVAIFFFFAVFFIYMCTFILEYVFVYFGTACVCLMCLQVSCVY